MKLTARRQAAEQAEAAKYAVALRTVGIDWPTYNADIIARFSYTALLRIKTQAWQIAESAR